MRVNLTKQRLGTCFTKNARRMLTRHVGRSYSYEQNTNTQEQSTREEEADGMVKYKPQYKLHFKPDKTVLLYQSPLPILSWKNWAMFALFNFFLYKVYMKAREKAWIRTLLYSGCLVFVGTLGVYQAKFRRAYISSIKLCRDGQTALFQSGLLGRRETLVTLKNIEDEQTEFTTFLEEGGLRRVSSGDFAGILDLGIDEDDEKPEGTPNIIEGIYVYDTPLLLEVINGKEVEIEEEHNDKFIDIK